MEKYGIEGGVEGGVEGGSCGLVGKLWKVRRSLGCGARLGITLSSLKLRKRRLSNILDKKINLVRSGLVII